MSEAGADQDQSAREPAANRPEPIFLKDYRPPAYLVDEVELVIRLDPEATEIEADLRVRRNPAGEGGALRLDGEDLELLEVRLDGEALAQERYEVDRESLTLGEVPEAFRLRTRVRIAPATNTRLEGLYLSRGIFCTQCEAEGFRRITYFPDRPDVMSRYRVQIEAPRAACPVLLSNGNLVASEDLPGGRHAALWEDPFPKPAYLFALVAGDLGRIADTFTTRSGRIVLLEIFTEHRHIDKCGHAMASLKRAMAWDEERFGLDYDLDRYMIVAISDFNMGAMENKGLNVFNTKYVLARPETATDADYLGIEKVIAHEYFHNWTGNRVTCRDWFQLSLKEGLTVFRDQEFTSDLHSRAVARIQDVRRLRSTQFQEDAGPLAHPVRPESYVEINNFYTTTVYEKGAEVIRMLHTLIGEDAFKKGMQLYFARHDGQAVTCDDFVAAMADASGRDLGRFRRWYGQAGTPEVIVRGHHDPKQRTFRLEVEQRTPPTPGQPDKLPVVLPLEVGLIDPDGSALPLRLEGENAPRGTSRVLEVSEERQTFVFADVDRTPVPSLFRGFSAPVRLDAGLDDAALRHLFAHDGDPFSRFEAGQTYATRLLLGAITNPTKGRPRPADPKLAEAFALVLDEAHLDPAFAAQALTLPSEGELGQAMAVIDVDGIHAARQHLRADLGVALAERWRSLHAELGAEDGFAFDAGTIGRRQLKNLALAYLVAAGDEAGLEACMAQATSGGTMTDRLAALTLLAATDHPARKDALARFYADWQDDDLVVDKWFVLQATAQRPDSVSTVRALAGHPAFTMSNPNRVRSLVAAFASGNPTGFHAADGSGYAFVVEKVLALDRTNPQVAARLSGAFARWRRHDEARQRLMRAALEQIVGTTPLSRDLYEIASKSLEG